MQERCERCRGKLYGENDWVILSFQHSERVICRHCEDFVLEMLIKQEIQRRQARLEMDGEAEPKEARGLAEREIDIWLLR